jgi:hypothetical protein
MEKRVTSEDPLTPAHSDADWETQGWGTESVPTTAATRLQSTISVRFDPDGAQELRRAARLRGITQSEFVRQATLDEARRTIAQAQIPVPSTARGQRRSSWHIEGRVAIRPGIDIREVSSALKHFDALAKRIIPRHTSDG